MMHMFTFIVTTLEMEAYKVIRFFCSRYKMENIIKEWNDRFGFSFARSHSKVINSSRLEIHVLACSLLFIQVSGVIYRHEKVSD